MPLSLSLSLSFVLFLPLHSSMLLSRFPVSHSRSICTSAALAKNLRAGVVKRSREQDIPLTYERSRKPNHIMRFKAWQSWNTSNLNGETQHTGLVTWQDNFIRYFVNGVFKDVIHPDVIIIKRQWNMIRVAFVLKRSLGKQKTLFLKGYSEEMLSYITDSPVKVEMSIVNDDFDNVFKFT